jgi:hypothetical protein
MFNHGRSNDASRTGGLDFTAAAETLGSVFVRHGYSFLYLSRRGEGLSADQGAFIGDILRREEITNGEEARKRLQLVLMTTDHLDDVLAGLSLLKNVPEVDANFTRQWVALQMMGMRLCTWLSISGRTTFSNSLIRT